MSNENGLAAFKQTIKDVRWAGGAIAGGILFGPIAIGLASFSPPWPDETALIVLTSLVEFLALLLSFQFFSEAAQSRVNCWILSITLMLGTLLIAYTMLDSIFVYQLPEISSTKSVKDVVLGCGLTPDAESVATYQHLPIRGQCPGDYHDLLREAGNEPTAIWTPWSVTAVKTCLLVSWLCIFGGFSFLLGVFISFQRRRIPVPEH
jgi:hypothetical protein